MVAVAGAVFGVDVDKCVQDNGEENVDERHGDEEI
jgi:hypothetical protein